MKPSDIQVGHTYCNRGKGTTRRTVLKIGLDLPRPFHSRRVRHDSLIVQYEQKGTVDVLYLFSFAAWAGRDVTDERGAKK